MFVVSGGINEWLSEGRCTGAPLNPPAVKLLLCSGGAFVMQA